MMKTPEVFASAAGNCRKVDHILGKSRKIRKEKKLKMLNYLPEKIVTFLREFQILFRKEHSRRSIIKKAGNISRK